MSVNLAQPNSNQITCDIVVAPLLSEPDTCQAHLSASEWRRLIQMKRHSRQCEFGSGRVLVRQQLAKALHCQPTEIELTIDKQGKPFCPHPKSPFFSISHSGNQVAVALCSQPIGIDIEQCQAKRKILQIAAHYYAKSELETLHSLSGAPEQADYFYQLWVLKEAIAKATGKGLGASLSSIELQSVGQEIRRINANDAAMQLKSTKLSKHLWLGVAVLTDNKLETKITQLEQLS